MITILSGGTGSIKLIRGLARVTNCNFTIIGNVGDNIWLQGLYICPDLDTIAYGLTGLLDEDRGWGVKGDTFNFLRQLKKYGAETWFQLGDKDLATHIIRTNLLRSGLSLSQTTDKICRGLGLKVKLIPASNMHIETRIITSQGEMHLQEYWVKRGGVDTVRGVRYHYENQVEPAPGVEDAISKARHIIICPANPITSIGPILAIPAIRNRIKEAQGKVVAVSPIIGKAPISGPAGNLMSGLGLEVSAIGVARYYSELLDIMVIDAQDTGLKGKIEEMGIEVIDTKIRMESSADEDRLARLLLHSLEG